jgi:FkbM family methyltransferase
MFRSHQGQDQWVIERALPGKTGGWFIDSGAGPDGIRGSNSYMLETEYGWKGLLVEPHPECVGRVRANRTAIVEQCCLTDSVGEVEFVLNVHPELSSITQHLSEPNFTAAGFGPAGHAVVPGLPPPGRLQSVKIPTFPLWELLRRHRAPPVIDYLSLDIEGAEWVALKDFPFDEFRILCMTIERGGKSYDKLVAKLRGEGYRLVRVSGPDDFYVHSSVNYNFGLPERMTTALRTTWNTWYFREPLLTARRAARRVRRMLRGY